MERILKNKFVTAFRGTRILSLADWHTDLQEIRGTNVPAYAEAKKLATRVNTATRGHLLFTGHSLGGAEASIAALATHHAAYTFNAAGVNPTMIKALDLHPSKAPSLITAYHTRDDIVSLSQKTLQLPQALGQSVELPDVLYGRNITPLVADTKALLSSTPCTSIPLQAPLALAHETLLLQEVLLHKIETVENAIKMEYRS